MKKILITGGKGLVGRYLKEVITKENFLVFSLGKEELNILDTKNIKETFKEIQPAIVIHLAALTDVDLCEKKQNEAFLINATGTKNITEMASKFNCFFIYLSTDFIFDGTKNSPYTENDKPNPINVYGKSKLMGEEFVKKICKRYLIIRTSRIFGKDGKNFGSKLWKIILEKKEIFLTTDIVNSPTYALDLAETILKLLKMDFCGIINVCNKGWCSWFEYGKKMKEILNINTNIIGINFENFAQISGVYAKRPKFSALSVDLLSSLNIEMETWEKALERFLKKENI